MQTTILWESGFKIAHSVQPPQSFVNLIFQFSIIFTCPITI